MFGNYTIRESFFDEAGETVRFGPNFSANSTTFVINTGYQIILQGNVGLPGQAILTDGTSLYWGNVSGGVGSIPATYVQNTDSRTLSGNLTFTGGVYISQLYANGVLGTNGQILFSNGTGAYWGNLSVGGVGTVTNVASGNGLSGGPISTTGTLSVLAGNNQLVSNATGLWLDQTKIDITALSGYSLYKFVDHTLVSITGSNGITGGGDITANRNLTLVLGNTQLFSNSTGLWANQANFDHNSLLNYSANQHVDHAGINMVAGNGMSGGGLITASRTFHVSAGNTQLISNSTGLWLDQTKIDITALVNYSTNKFIDHSTVNVISGNGLSGGGDITASRTLNVLAGNTQLFSNSTGLWANQANFDHDSLTNYSANQHVDHTSVSITASNGLSGGGTIASTRTLSVVAGNTQLFVNATGVWANQANFDHNSLTNYVANQHVDHTSVTMTAGNGMSGGGTIAATRTFNVLAGNNQLVSNSTGLWLDQTKIDITALTNYAANKFIDHTTVSISPGVGLSGGGDISATRTLSVIANTGIVANTTGLFVNTTYIGTLSANNSAYLGGVAAASYVQNTDSRTLSGNLTFTGLTTFSNTILGGLSANGSYGAAGQVLTSNGTSTYWASAAGGSAVAKTYSRTVASSGQNTFTISGYQTGLVDVYYNGIHLTRSDYTEANTTAIQLNVNAVAGSIIELVGYTNAGSLSVPAGLDTQINFNDGGLQAGSANLTFKKANSAVTLGAGVESAYITVTSSTSGTVTVDTFALSDFRTAKYLVSMKDNNANNYQSSEVMLLQDGGIVNITEYATIISNTNMGSFSATANATTAILQFAAASSNNITFKMSRKAIVL